MPEEEVRRFAATRFDISVDPVLDRFRSDRRFTRLLKRYLTPVERAAHQSASLAL
jgi:hypothetical protein